MDQRALWQHYQGEAAHTFEASSPRHDHLVRRLRAVSRVRAPVVLNVGAGNGYFERQVLAAGMRVSSLDPDAGTIARLKSEGIDGVAGSMTQMPFAGGSFDVVVASEVLEHLSPADAERALQEVGRVLKPGGAFIGTVPFNERLEDNQVFCPHCGQVFHRWGHQQSFSREALRELLGRSLRVEACDVRSFVAYRGRSWRGKLKSAFKDLLGRLGEPIASPHLLFVARRP